MCRLEDLRKERSRLLRNYDNFHNVLKDNDEKSHSDHMADGMATRATVEFGISILSKHIRGRLLLINTAISEEIINPTPEHGPVQCANGKRCEGDGFISPERIEIVPESQICGACAIAIEKASQR